MQEVEKKLTATDLTQDPSRLYGTTIATAPKQNKHQPSQVKTNLSGQKQKRLQTNPKQDMLTI